MADKRLDEPGSRTEVMGEQGLADPRLGGHQPHGTLVEPVLDDAALEGCEDFRLPLDREIPSSVFRHYIKLIT